MQQRMRLNHVGTIAGGADHFFASQSRKFGASA
jgi:hypothetical protein